MSTVIGRDPASLLFVSLASQMFPSASNAALEKAAGIASRHFRHERFAMKLGSDGGEDYYRPVHAIAAALDGDVITEAQRKLEDLHTRFACEDIEGTACSRWTPEIDAGVLFGVWLGVHLASIVGAEGER